MNLGYSENILFHRYTLNTSWIYSVYNRVKAETIKFYVVYNDIDKDLRIDSGRVMSDESCQWKVERVKRMARDGGGPLEGGNESIRNEKEASDKTQQWHFMINLFYLLWFIGIERSTIQLFGFSFFSAVDRGGIHPNCDDKFQNIMKINTNSLTDTHTHTSRILECFLELLRPDNGALCIISDFFVRCFRVRV